MSMTPSQARQLGVLIAKARARKGLSVRDLASQTQVAIGWVAGVEAGNNLDPAPDRLARFSEVLDIDPARIDRLTRGAMSEGLPAPRAYFRAKYELTPDEVAKVERYINGLERKRRVA
jgi:transcriptional regulator with XRE-family HTH domain